MTISQFVALAKSRGYNTKETQRKFLKWFLFNRKKINKNSVLFVK